MISSNVILEEVAATAVVKELIYLSPVMFLLLWLQLSLIPQTRDSASEHLLCKHSTITACHVTTLSSAILSQNVQGKYFNLSYHQFVNHARRTREAHPRKTLIAGNVVTGEMVEELILSGADIVKVTTWHHISWHICHVTLIPLFWCIFHAVSKAAYVENAVLDLTAFFSVTADWYRTGIRMHHEKADWCGVSPTIRRARMRRLRYLNLFHPTAKFFVLNFEG